MRTEPPTGDELTRMLVTMKQRVLEEASADPAPARRRARNRAIITGTAILLTLGLGAGAAIAAGMISDDEPPAAQPQPGATTPATQYATPTPRPFLIETEAPVDPLTLVTTIVVRPHGLELTDESGTLVRTLSYEGDGAGTAAVLAAVLDADPAVTEMGAPEGDPTTRMFAWDGLTLVEYLQPKMHRADTRLWVRSELPTVGDGVSVTTSAGFSAGDELATYAAAQGLPYDVTGQSAQDLVALEYGPALGPDRAGYVDAYAVVATANLNYGNLVSLVTAPFNFAPEDGTG